MRNTKALLIIIILTSVWACKPPVTFNEPQPTGTNNLSEIPKRLQGQYISLADGSSLTVTGSLIKRECDINYKISSKHLDSNLRLAGDTLINIKTHETSIIKREADSIIMHAHYTDTLFQINNDNVVRKFKGFYFLNKLYAKDRWEVKKVELAKGELTISSISEKADLDNLKEITESTQDTTPRSSFTATKKQFKEFVKKGGFSFKETFERQKK